MNEFLNKIKADTKRLGPWKKRSRERNKPREVSVAKGVYIVTSEGRRFAVVAENFDSAKQRIGVLNP